MTVKFKAVVDECDCNTCQDSENPCGFDCDEDMRCQGCHERAIEAAEVAFESAWALGRR